MRPFADIRSFVYERAVGRLSQPRLHRHFRLGDALFLILSVIVASVSSRMLATEAAFSRAT
jgi:hypothetical protein